MRTYLVLWALVVVAACDDSAADDDEPDVTPPSLASVTPGADMPVWLHAPIRVTFDEPLDHVAMNVTATVGGAAVPAEVAFEAPSTLAITLAPDTRGVGPIDVSLTGSVTDLAGNAFVAPIDLTFVAPAWSTANVDRGYARTAPALAVGADGTVYAAWLVGDAGARRAVVSALVGNTWQPFGAELGHDDVASVAIALDRSGAPLVAWSDDGHAHVARWSDAWNEYTSPGAADHVALVTPPNGAPLLALFGATAAAYELDGSKWHPLGTAITVKVPIVGEPALAAGAAGSPALGWVGADGKLRVYRYSSGWTAIAPLSVGPDSRLALAAHGGSLAVAYDQYAGSYGVLAAQAADGATAWTFLGRALDIDISGDAVAPAIAYDSSGAPVVAWTERVETNERGALARWDGSAWTIVGGITWLDDAQAVPSRSRIALGAGDAPVVATSAGGALHLARFNGPRVAGVGLTSRVSIAGCRFDANNPPAHLSQTGCFDLSTPKQPVPHRGLIPYDVVVDLWSDGAKKRRYIGLPDNKGMTTNAGGGWDAPVGTMAIKQFDLETTPGNPATRRPIETRFWVNSAMGWRGFSYKWNEAGTDASLLPNDELTFQWQLDDGTQHTHVHPSRAQCVKCHAPPHSPEHTEGGMGPLLGVRPEQLARWYDYDGVIADQLQTLAALGVAPVSSATPFISPHQPNETVDNRVRGYMAGNCMHCHNPMHPSVWDMRYTTPFAQMNLCSDITPGNPASSGVYELVTRRPWGMPCIGTLAVDPLAKELFASWIGNMRSCP
ncbi:MAG: hypothetical protein HOV81_43240 [Kofleriaceae bacterium]|nr:hypothetical protein [Kofleriaceae bacterium]